MTPEHPAPPRPGDAADALEAHLALLEGWVADDLRREVVHLRRAVRSNRRIGAAVGIVMHDRRLLYDDAFALLRRRSQDTNTPLADVAELVIQHGRLDPR